MCVKPIRDEESNLLHFRLYSHHKGLRNTGSSYNAITFEVALAAIPTYKHTRSRGSQCVGLGLLYQRVPEQLVVKAATDEIFRASI